jgi:hypothetical protein
LSMYTHDVVLGVPALAVVSCATAASPVTCAAAVCVKTVHAFGSAAVRAVLVPVAVFA